MNRNVTETFWRFGTVWVHKAKSFRWFHRHDGAGLAGLSAVPHSYVPAGLSGARVKQILSTSFNTRIWSDSNAWQIQVVVDERLKDQEVSLPAMTLNFYVQPLANNQLNSRIQQNEFREWQEASHWKNSGALVCVVPCKCVSFVPPGIGGCVCNNCSLGFVHHKYWGRRACANTTLRPQRHKCRSKHWVFRVCFLLVNATCFTSSFFGASESPQCTAFRKVLRHQDDGKSRKIDLSRQHSRRGLWKIKEPDKPPHIISSYPPGADSGFNGMINCGFDTNPRDHHHIQAQSASASSSIAIFGGINVH